MVSRIGPITNTPTEPVSGKPLAISISITVMQSDAPITMAGTVIGDINI
ncbi:hypothetical protein [Ensifer aridi]|nr:hypothetical protein [Ensifer aridi]